MEAALINLLTGNPEPWQVFAGILILSLLVIPRFMALRDSWMRYRQNRGQLELQKQELEILKLKYEVETLRKTLGLEEAAPAGGSEVSTVQEITPARQPSAIWLFLVRHPLAGELLIIVLQGFTGLYLLAFGLGSLTMPFVFFFPEMLELSPEDKLDPLVMAVGWLFYVALTYFLYRGYKRVRQWRVELRTDVNTLDTKNVENADPGEGGG